MQNFKNPIFQKRHYEFVADVIKDFVNEYEKKFGMGDSENDLIIEISKFIGNHFAKEFIKISPKNDDGKPLFDKDKFLDRIGIK